MKKIKAIVFDYDGVIVESELFRRNILNQLLKPHGKQIKEDDKRLIGRKTHQFLQEAFPEMTDKETISIREAWQEQRMKQSIPLVVGVKETIDYAQKTFKTGITTGSTKKEVQQTIENQQLGEFNIIVTGEDFSSSKPDPECYHLALSRLETQPEETLIIEDSLAGIKAGKTTGCTVYGLGTYHDQEEILTAGADEYFSDHTALLQFLKKH
ncbi:HAD family phosphatase [Candidatus Woesearchaeota archaeon]|nr:HAD family phosphatase [Candidatus Woesearchaeota archaeon]